MEKNRRHRWWLLNLSEAIWCSWYIFTIIFDKREVLSSLSPFLTSEKSVCSIYCQASPVIATLTSKIKKSTKTKMNYLPWLDCLLQFQTVVCSGNPRFSCGFTSMTTDTTSPRQVQSHPNSTTAPRGRARLHLDDDRCICTLITINATAPRWQPMQLHLYNKWCRT